MATTVLLAGLGALGCAVAGVGPQWVDGAGAIAVSTVLSVALAHRTGGRPVVALLLALAIGLAAVVVGGPTLQTGAAVLTVVVGGVYAVMATVPAVSFWRAAREVLFATVVSAITAVAAVGFEPTVTEPRFDYTSILLSLALVFAVVHRLGAGIHGLGRRGLIVVLVGVAVLVLTLAYGELFRRYGAGSVVGSALDFASLDRRPDRGLPAPAGRVPRHPRPAVGLLPARPAPPGMVGVRLRCHRYRADGGGPARAGRLVPRGGTARHLLPRPRPVARLPPRPRRPGLTAPRGRRGRRAEEADAHRPEPSRFAELDPSRSRTSRNPARSTDGLRRGNH